MLYGMNLFLWADHLDERLMPVLEMLKQQGWDGVEVPVLDWSVNYEPWGKRLDNLGLRRTAITARTAETNPISPDPRVRAAAVDATRRELDFSRLLGAEILGGPLHSALGVFSGQQPTADEWRWGIDSVRQMAEHAEQAGVTLAVEYLNRFECYLLNHAADMVRFVKEVDHPRCRILYDTFHANIEEKDPAQAIRTVAPYLVQVHLAENDRSTPGQGSVRWNETFHTLREVGFDGWLVVEAFGMALPALQAATKIWRRMFQSEEQLARDSLAHIKANVARGS